MFLFGGLKQFVSRRGPRNILGLSMRGNAFTATTPGHDLRKPEIDSPSSAKNCRQRYAGAFS
jgi:hypothetical protein